MGGDTQDEENLDCAWRNVELILKIEAIAAGFSPEAKPQIEARLREQYGSRFAEARARGKAEQEAHVLAMSCLDDHAALRRDLAARFLTKEEEIARQPVMVFWYPFLQAKISAAVAIGVFWRELQLRLFYPAVESLHYFVNAVLALGIVAVVLTLVVVSVKRRNTRKALTLSALAGFSWTPFYAVALYFFGGPKPALLSLLLCLGPTTIWLIVCRRLYRKTCTNQP